jgi:hypothetical protein
MMPQRTVNPYWRIFAEEVPSDLGIELTAEQVEALAEAAEGAAENQSTACGWDMIPNPDRAEIDRLEKLLKEARRETELAEDVWREALSVIGGVPMNKLYRDREQIKVAR